MLLYCMMEKLTKMLQELEQKIPLADKVNVAVSQSSVGWHIDHTLIVTNAICSAVSKSDPAKYKWKFNFMKTLVYTMGKIPRGKVKAPKSVTPVEVFENERLKQSFQKAYTEISGLDQLNKDCYFRHPYFGDLNVKPTKKFLEIHTRHHLNIIEDIIKKA